MDLDLSWEKKALIGLGVIALIIVIYAYNPLHSPGEVIVQNDTPAPQPLRTMPFTTTSSESNNTTQTNTTSLNITSQQAKEIAAETGLRTGEPASGSIKINNETISVWIVPLYKQNKLEKEVYVNKVNGNIVATKEF